MTVRRTIITAIGVAVAAILVVGIWAIGTLPEPPPAATVTTVDHDGTSVPCISMAPVNGVARPCWETGRPTS